MSQDVNADSVLGVLGLTPRDVKLAIKDGTVQLMAGQPKIPNEHSEFQKRRIKASFPVVWRYLKGGRTVTQLAQEMKVTHQRISQVLSLGVGFLVGAGHIVPVSKNGGAPNGGDVD